MPPRLLQQFARTTSAPPPATADEIARALEGVREVLESSDAQFASRAFMLSKLKKIGIAHNDWDGMRRYAEWLNSGQFGVQQLPTEYIDFLMYVATFGCTTGIEVGVWYGASSYFTAAVLQRANPNFVLTMVDIEDRLVAFDAFAALLNLEKHVPATAEDFAGREYDCVFIDGDHSYPGVQRDYLLLGRHAKRVVAFHDIRGHEFNHLAGGTVRFWQEFVQHHCEDMTIAEFAHYPVPWLGIGVAVRDR